MDEPPLRLHLARVVGPEPAIRYATVAEVPPRCPRTGCGGLLRDWPDGKLCGACGRLVYVDARHLREALE